MEALSTEEIRALLAEPEAPAATEALLEACGERQARVLFVARRDSAAGLLSNRLTALGGEVVVARNPFQALDRIRLEPPQAIVSELGLWANEGELLFRRLAAANCASPVLLVAPQTTMPDRLVERLTRAGAWGVIFEPISPQDAETAAERLLECACAARSDGGSDGGRGSSPGPAHVLPEGSPEPVFSREAVSASSAEESSSAAESTAEPAWGPVEELVALRVHLAVSRAQQLALVAAERAAEILRGIRELAVARGLAVSFQDQGRWRAILEAESDQALLCLSRLLAGDNSEHGEHSENSDPDGQEDGLILGSAQNARLVLAGLAPRQRQALEAFGVDISRSLALALVSGR